MSNYLSNPGHVTKKFGGADAPVESVDSTIGMGEDNPMMGIGMGEDNPMMGVGMGEDNPVVGTGVEEDNPVDANDSTTAETPVAESANEGSGVWGGIPDEALPPVAKFKDDESFESGTVVSAGFTIVDGDHKIFAREYAPQMGRMSYVGDTAMLLGYLFREERKHKITMPIRACGVDPIVFQNVERLTEGDETTPYFTIPGEGVDNIYELINVDGELYMSCMSGCLDPDYLHNIITTATTTMMETGSYIYRMVGLKRLANVEGEETGRLIKTLRLNTYEMSALCAYMTDFGVEPSFEMVDGHRCICFRTER